MLLIFTKNISILSIPLREIYAKVKDIAGDFKYEDENKGVGHLYGRGKGKWSKEHDIIDYLG